MPGRPFCLIEMARQLDEPEDLNKLKRELQEALQKCDELVARTRRLLRRSKQERDKSSQNQPRPFMLRSK